MRLNAKMITMKNIRSLMAFAILALVTSSCETLNTPQRGVLTTRAHEIKPPSLPPTTETFAEGELVVVYAFGYAGQSVTLEILDVATDKTIAREPTYVPAGQALMLRRIFPVGAYQAQILVGGSVQSTTMFQVGAGRSQVGSSTPTETGGHDPVLDFLGKMSTTATSNGVVVIPYVDYNKNHKIDILSEARGSFSETVHGKNSKFLFLAMRNYLGREVEFRLVYEKDQEIPLGSLMKVGQRNEKDRESFFVWEGTSVELLEKALLEMTGVKPPTGLKQYALRFYMKGDEQPSDTLPFVVNHDLEISKP